MSLMQKLIRAVSGNRDAAGGWKRRAGAGSRESPTCLLSGRTGRSG